MRPFGKLSLKPVFPRFAGIMSCAAFIFIATCSKNSLLNLSPYKPVITFSGIVGPDSLYLPGSREYPNTCGFDADTVRMYFYSEEFSQGPISSGDELRIDIFTADSEFITKRHARLHFTRYDYSQNTCTFEVSPADTLNDYNTLSMHRTRLEWKSGGAVLLDAISATARPLGSYGTDALSLNRGVISGNIE
jgi:hypothetical protein